MIFGFNWDADEEYINDAGRRGKFPHPIILLLLSLPVGYIYKKRRLSISLSI